MESKKKGYLKIYIPVYIKSKKIFSMMKVTYEHVGDSNALAGLVVENLIKSDRQLTVAYYLLMVLMIVMIFLDVCSDSRILPCIKV